MPRLHITIIGQESKAPDTSWWTTAPREDFSGYVMREHLARMNGGWLALEAKDFAKRRKVTVSPAGEWN